MTDASDDARRYGAHYYRTACGSPYRRDDLWLGHFGRIAERVVAEIQPKTVLDAGCAHGFLVEALRDRGVEAFGIDISDYAISQVRHDVAPYCAVGSVLEPLGRRFDLIVCIEVLEHLPPDQASDAVSNLCAATDDVLFSSTPDDFAEPTHLNVRQPEYWAELFAREGLWRDVDFDASFIATHAVRFRRSEDPIHRRVADYERRLWHDVRELESLRRALLDTSEQLRLADERISELERFISSGPRAFWWALWRFVRQTGERLIARLRRRTG